MEIKNKELLKEVNNLIKDYDKLTTSDLQGLCYALSVKFGVSDDYLLNYVFGKVV